MFIQLAKRFHENKDGSISVYPNYRLMKAYRDTDGKPRKRAVLSLGVLEGMADAGRDIRPVYHKTDDGIKAHLNLAVLAYWVVFVNMHRLKVKGYKNVRWDEIMRIASTQVVVTAKVQTEDGREISIRQSTQAEDKRRHLRPAGCQSTPARQGKIRRSPKIAFKK